MTAPTLDAYLTSSVVSRGPAGEAIAGLVRALAGAAAGMRTLLSQVSPATLGRSSLSRNPDGDFRRYLDVRADETFLAAARQAGVRHYCSGELDEAVDLNGSSGLALAIDPLDGSSGIDANVPAGTVFSILPARLEAADAAVSFLRQGRDQFAAGFFVYGPQLALALTLGAGTRIFVHSSRLGSFVESPCPGIAERTREFAINASNYRHWDERLRLYFDDCLKGAEGPRERDFDMRWVASLVAEAYRILMRGGVFLDPADSRRGFAQGRLSLVYEANPIAMLVEQAGGAATDGLSRILDVEPSSVHQRTPLVFGSPREVARVGRYLSEPSLIAERSPLFGNRGLFRA